MFTRDHTNDKKGRATASTHPVVQPVSAPTPGAPAGPRRVIQRQKNGLPDRLKSGVETLSGLSMDDVTVHYNSLKPAQFQALAYTQGMQIHVAPGQEKYLPHEAWHVVQQAQGRVKPTLQMKDGVLVNDDAGLEKEADVMGKKSADEHFAHRHRARNFKAEHSGQSVVQRAVGFEFETNVKLDEIDTEKKQALKEEIAKLRLADKLTEMEEKEQILSKIELPTKEALPQPKGTRWYVESDSDNLEFVTKPLNSMDQVEETIGEIEHYVRGADPFIGQPFRDMIPQPGKKDVPEYAYIITTGNFNGRPQATVGTRLERIGNMLESMFKTPMEKAYQDRKAPKGDPITIHHGQKGKLANSVVARVNWYVKNKVKNKEKYKDDLAKFSGFLSLVCSYITGIRTLETRPEYPKSAISLMARNNFHEIYQELGLASELFTLDAVKFITERNGDDRLYPYGLDSLPEIADKGPTIRAWIQSIIDPSGMNSVDLGVNAWHENVTKDYSQLKGNNNQPADLLSLIAQQVGVPMANYDLDRSNPALPLILLEIRSMSRMGEHQPDEWLPLAKIIYLMSEKINA